jgi:hypothetical protein
MTQPSGFGLTVRMKETLAAITAHVALHGVMPSRRSLGAALGCNANNASRLMAALIERGELSSRGGGGGSLAGFGNAGVAIFIPADLAAKLAAFCIERSEKLPAVVADAVTLHLDQLGDVE